MTRQRAEQWTLATLVLLWALFFWRILTPIPPDQASFTQGDFSGQFVAFGGYHDERFEDFEVPLWNPHNNSGLPFIADTQAASFYPPRMLTMGLMTWFDDWHYRSLELEAIVHVLAYTLAMFAFVRRLTDSIAGGFVAAVVGGYGGYLSGYPPLQLALLEAGVWLPLALMGVFEATKSERVRAVPLILTGLALWCSWLAGHPQTSWFLTYLTVAYFAYRCWAGSYKPRVFVWGVAFFGILTVGATAVTLVPGVEYLANTARAGMGYAAKGNGFPFQDIIQFVYPGVVSVFSPLYVGVVGLLLALTALRLPFKRVGFWFGVALFGLVLGFGSRTALFPALYNTLPGLRFFRGQERAVYLVAHSLAILAGIGTAGLIRGEVHRGGLIFRRLLLGTLLLTGVVFVAGSVLWLGWREPFGEEIGTLAFVFMIAVAAYVIGTRFLERVPDGTARPFMLALLALLTFELFSMNMDSDANYDDVPPSEQLAIEPPPLVQPVIPDEGEFFRVDGFRGLMDNYASLYGAYDARGISPLFLDGPYQLQQEPFATAANFETNPVFWELNAVRYVYSGFDALPVESEIITEGADRYGPVYLHELNDPRPFAHLVYQADVADSDAFARELLADDRYDEREAVIVGQTPTLDLPNERPAMAVAEVTTFEPERITVSIETAENALLSLAHPDYPGWRATLDGEPVELLRAYGGFTAVEVPPGEHTLTLVYRPLTFYVGLALTVITWVFFALAGAREILRDANDE